MAKDILVHPSMKDVVQNKTKKITIRKGQRNYKEEDIIRVGCDSYGWYPVVVTDVEYMDLGVVGWDAIAADGFRSWQELYDTMKKFYPDIEADTPVTLIRWEYL
jgi:hypothetical protein